MGKVFSWKIDDKNYAYILIPNSKKHISERITDIDTINTIINKVSQWSEQKYQAAFNEMSKEILKTFGIDMPYSSEYFGKETEDKNIIIMGASKEELTKIDELKNEILDLVDTRFSKILSDLKDFKDEMMSLVNKRTIDSVKASKEIFNESMDSVNDLKLTMEKRFNDATETLEKASKILDLNNNEINTESLLDLFKTANRSDKWIKSYSGDIETIKTDYKLMEKKVSPMDKTKGVFSTVLTKIDKIDEDFIKLKDDNKIIKNSITNIENEQKRQKEITLKNI